MGPSQICGCLFREPRVFTIAHMHNSFCRQTVFTHRKFSAQKSYAKKVLRTTFFTYRCFYTQMSLHRHKLHTETCAHSTRLHTQPTSTQRGFASSSWSPTFRVPPLKFVPRRGDFPAWSCCASASQWRQKKLAVAVVHHHDELEILGQSGKAPAVHIEAATALLSTSRWPPLQGVEGPVNWALVQLKFFPCLFRYGGFLK